MGVMKRWRDPEGRFEWSYADEDDYTEEEQFADWVDKMIRAEEAEDG